MHNRYRPRIFKLIDRERQKQIAKWGHQTHSGVRWVTILTEEVGEAAMAVLQYKKADLFNELIQVAAVAVAWVEAMMEDETTDGR